MSDYIHTHAEISSCGRYRYSLTREWRGTHKHENWHWTGTKDGAGRDYGWPLSCVFVMLNPSTADAEQDDPTIRRCVSFAKRWQYERLTVVNLFAYRATNPFELFKLDHNDDPVGVGNQAAFNKAMADAGLIVCAWGAHGGYMGQDQTALGWLDKKDLFCFGFTTLQDRVDHTRAKQPRHPLYVRSDTELVRMP